MASFDMEEIPKHVFQQLIATQKQSVLIWSRQETYGLCYCVSYWRKHTRAPAEAELLQLIEECWKQMTMTQLSCLWEWRYLSRTKNNPLLQCWLRKQSMRRNYSEYKNTDRMMEESAQKLRWDAQWQHTVKKAERGETHSLKHPDSLHSSQV